MTAGHETSPLNGRRILVVGCGSPAVSEFPSAVLQLALRCPDSPLRLVLTRQALQFVTAQAIRIVTGRRFFLDTWTGTADEGAPHVEMSEWAEAVIVHPATLHFVSRLALGLTDTPLLLALQCSTAPLALGPSLPPGGAESAAYGEHVARLATRPHVAVVPPVLGMSMSTRKINVGAPAPFADAMSALEKMMQEGDEER